MRESRMGAGGGGGDARAERGERAHQKHRRSVDDEADRVEIFTSAPKTFLSPVHREGRIAGEREFLYWYPASGVHARVGGTLAGSGGRGI